MSLGTYSDLQTQIANWLHRSDLTTYIPDFITLFEAHACRELRVRPTETTTTLTPSSGTATLPSDFLGLRRVTWTGSPLRELEYVSPPYLQFNYPTAQSGNPNVYTIEGGNLIVRPSDNTPLSVVYRAKTAAVSSSLNWLYTNHPDAYLFGSLAEAYGFTEDPENLAIWKSRRDEVFGSIKTMDFHYRELGSPRVMGPTP